MKRKVVMKLLCVTIVSAMLVANTSVLSASDGVTRTVIYQSQEIQVTVTADSVILPDGQVIPLSEFTGQFLDNPQPAQPETTEESQTPTQQPEVPEQPGGDNTNEGGETPTEPETPGGETPEGENPEGETPEGETPEGETPEGENPEGETPEGETPEEETPEGETPEGENPEGENPEGETPEEENPGTDTGEGNESQEDGSGESETDSSAETGEEDSAEDKAESLPPQYLAGIPEEEPDSGSAKTFSAEDLTPQITPGGGFYLDELEDDYRLTFGEDFQDVVKEIEDEFLNGKDTAQEENSEEEAEQSQTPYLLKMASLAEEEEDRAEVLELVEAAETEPELTELEETELVTLELTETGLTGTELTDTEEPEAEETASKEAEPSEEEKESEVVFTNWQDVLAVYLLKEYQAGADTFVMDRQDKDGLAAVFAEMNTVTEADGERIITSLTAEDYIAAHEARLSDADREFLERYTSSSCTLLCAAATGMQEFITAGLGEDVSEERARIVAAAYSLVGKVSYFWGGKSSSIGWDSRWGDLAQITAPGIDASGSVQQFGLDCSGFVTWAFINGYEDTGAASLIGHGTASQWWNSEAVTEEEALPGDLVFLQAPGAGGINHVGIVAGKEDDGSLVVIHCNAGDNGVSVESAYSAGFRYVRRPLALTEE